MTNASRRLAIRATLLATALLATAVPALASGPKPAGYSPTMSVAIGQRCVFLQFVGNTSADMIVKQWRAGADPDTDAPVATGTAVAPITERETVCVKTIKAGDLLRMAQPSALPNAYRDVTVPPVTLEADLATDTITMSSPNEKMIYLRDRVAGITGNSFFRQLPAGDDQSWPTDTVSQDLNPGDGVSAYNDDGFGISAFRVWVARTVTVRAGSSAVTLTGMPNTTVTATLRTADGTVRATARCVLPADINETTAGTCTTTWKKSGQAVRAKAGNRVVTPDGSYVVRTTASAAATADFNGVPVTISATCPKNGAWALATNLGFFASGVTPADGKIALEKEGVPGTVTSATLGCATTKGFGQQYPVTLAPAP